MNTIETVTLIVMLGVIILAALVMVASAQEWLNLSGSLSLKFIPAAKRQPRTAVDVKVIPGIAEPVTPSIATVRRTGT